MGGNSSKAGGKLQILGYCVRSSRYDVVSVRMVHSGFSVLHIHRSVSSRWKYGMNLWQKVMLEGLEREKIELIFYILNVIPNP